MGETKNVKQKDKLRNVDVEDKERVNRGIYVYTGASIYNWLNDRSNFSLFHYAIAISTCYEFKA